MPYSPSDEIIFNGYDRPGIDFRFWNAARPGATWIELIAALAILQEGRALYCFRVGSVWARDFGFKVFYPFYK